MPDTIQEVILARIDRLAEAPKGTLQLAAVIGREFTAAWCSASPTIREPVDDALGELTALDLIYETGYLPEWRSCSSTR